MGIEPVDPRAPERGVDSRVQILGHRHKARGARPIRIAMDDPVVVENRELSEEW
jgi:hypothetical protein